MDYKIDGKNKILGRLASEIALILQGKKSPKYEPRNVGSDRVLLKNFRDVAVSGKKFKEKIYYRHTGYVGHLKKQTYEEIVKKDPRQAVREAVRRMLPKNFLNAKRLKNLIFIENDNGSTSSPQNG
ncbi:MAG: 50S ribosomal protein L13 [Candidatus Liptonbacteria bacterium]|nr:50S ribosomal protein L13 [Candidatus Liptonbacteria bacterium]